VGVRDTETKCVRPSEINRFFGGLSTRRWQCTYPVRQVGNGNARFEGSCTDRKGRRVNVRLNGTYQQESFTFRGGAQLARHGRLRRGGRGQEHGAGDHGGGRQGQAGEDGRLHGGPGAEHRSHD
jgi:hypothetical protein